MSAEDIKQFEQAIMNVRAKLVRGQLGENPMWKRAADSYAQLFQHHKNLQSIGHQMQKLNQEQQNIGATINKMAGAMEVMEQVLSEELIKSGVPMENLTLQDIQNIAKEQASMDTTGPAVGLSLGEPETKE